MKRPKIAKTEQIIKKMKHIRLDFANTPWYNGNTVGFAPNEIITLNGGKYNVYFKTADGLEFLEHLYLGYQ